MLKLRDIMTTDLVTLSPTDTLRFAADLFSSEHVSGAPVVRDGGIAGVLSASDLLSFVASHPVGPPSAEPEPSWADWNTADMGATPSASPTAFFTDPWTSVGEDTDESNPMAEGTDWDSLDQHTVEEVMTRKLWALTPDDDVSLAASLMEKAGIHRVIVVDQGRLVGVVTTSDITAAVGA